MTGRGSLRRRFALDCRAVRGEEDKDNADDDDQAGRSYGEEGRRVVQLPRAAETKRGKMGSKTNILSAKKFLRLKAFEITEPNKIKINK